MRRCGPRAASVRLGIGLSGSDGPGSAVGVKGTSRSGSAADVSEAGARCGAVGCRVGGD